LHIIIQIWRISYRV